MALKALMGSLNLAPSSVRKDRMQCGISLIEVLVVIALLIIGLWLMMNVFPVGQRALRVLRERNLARTIAERIAYELANSAKFEGGLLPDNPALYEYPLADLRRLDLPVDRTGDGIPDEPPDGKRTIEDLLELRRRLRWVVGESLTSAPAITALAPINSVIETHRYQPYTEASSLTEVTPGKYFVDYSRTPPEIVVMFAPNQTKRYRISYIAQVGGQKFIANEELIEAAADASGIARITPRLLVNAQGQIILVISVKEIELITNPLTLTDEQKRAGVIPPSIPPPEYISYELGSDGAWMMCWGRTEGSTGGVIFDPIPKPLISKLQSESSTTAGIAAFGSSLLTVPDTEFEINQTGMVLFSNLNPDTLIRLSYKSARSPNQLIDNWFFVPFVPPLSFTPSPAIVGGTPVEVWREYFLDLSDREKIFVAGMWSGLLLNVTYVDAGGNRRSILRRVEYDPQRVSWKGVIYLPTPYVHVEKVEGASIKVWVSGRFFLGVVGGKRPLNLGSVIEKEALIVR